jgi:hypothetical protein
VLVPGRASGRHTSRAHLTDEPHWFRPRCACVTPRRRLAVAVPGVDPAGPAACGAGHPGSSVRRRPRRSVEAAIPRNRTALLKGRHDPTRPSLRRPTELDPPVGEGARCSSPCCGPPTHGYCHPVPGHVAGFSWSAGGGVADAGRVGAVGHARAVAGTRQPVVPDAPHGHADLSS